MSEITNTNAHEILKSEGDAITASREKVLRLSRRELEVLHFVVAGESNKVIAHILDISQRTVENHRNRIIEKTGCKSQAALTCLFALAVRECIPYCSITKKCNHTYADCPIENKLYRSL